MSDPGLEPDMDPAAADAEVQMRRISRRSFLWAGVALASGAALGRWVVTRPVENGILSPLRRGLEWNERAARTLFRPTALAPTFPLSRAEEPKVNGFVGMESDLDADAWRLHVRGSDKTALTLGMSEVRALPRVELVTEHKCVEGWSVVVQWAGARLADFIERYPPSASAGGSPEGYVGLATPDGLYYVGLEWEAAIHPQTLLCYEMNGEPLSDEHGAPLRLVTPIKYGVKSLKRIGTLTYSRQRPADYWAEQGYDWYLGL